MTQFVDDFDKKETLILRDTLALERTKLANERTLFSYIRTSLYLLTVGIGIIEIESIRNLIVISYICLLSGIILFFMGLFRYNRLRKHLKTYVSGNTIP